MPKNRHDPSTAAARSAQNTMRPKNYEEFITKAFQKDCEDLLKKYKALETFTFRPFAELWRAIKFTQALAIETFPGQLQRLLEIYLPIAKKFLMHDDLYIQTGAVFLLYSLYYRQPTRDLVKIRLTLNEWKKLVGIIDSLKMCRHLEAPFVFAKCCMEGAFEHVMESQPMCLDENHPRHPDMSLKMFDVSTVDVIRKNFKNTCEGAIPHLENTEREYQSLLQKYAAKYPQLQTIPSKNVEQVRTICGMICGDTKPVETRRQEAVRRAVTNKHAVYRAERRTITGVAMEEGEDLF